MYDYGLLKYRYSINIGDEVQSLAARRFLPRVDAHIPRDNWSETSLKRKTKLIANGWYLEKEHQWPPQNDLIEPLFVAFHVHEPNFDTIGLPQSIDYLKRHEPIGCRDEATEELLKSFGIDAYFSGCLTLTIDAPRQPKSDKIYLVDNYFDAASYLPQDLKSHVHEVTQLYTPMTSFLKKFENRLSVSSFNHRLNLAQNMLSNYTSARFVITGRLHCALPCTAMGIPVLYVIEDAEDPRYGKLLDHANTMTVEEFKDRAPSIDWDNPPFEAPDISKTRSALEATCKAFIAAD